MNASSAGQQHHHTRHHAEGGPSRSRTRQLPPPTMSHRVLPDGHSAQSTSAQGAHRLATHPAGAIADEYALLSHAIAFQPHSRRIASCGLLRADACCPIFGVRLALPNLFAICNIAFWTASAVPPNPAASPTTCP